MSGTQTENGTQTDARLIAANFGTLDEVVVEYLKRPGTYSMDADHFHAFYEIYYLVAGRRIYFVKDRTYTVEQGDLVFIDRSVLHKTISAGEDSIERVLLYFDERFLTRHGANQQAFLLSPFRQASPVLRLPRQEQLAADATLRRVISEIRERPTGFELVPARAAVELLLLAARYLERHEPLPLHLDTPIHGKISEVVRYINHHYEEPIKLQLLADRFYISPYHLSRMFKEVTGFSLTDYLTLTRVKEAQRLLRESELSITEVAAATGFNNFSHFGKTFKKITRLTPRDYRLQGEMARPY
ncbi:helix-turn-helix transcriptional regulator [Paenibacillus sp. IB182496]|uniref:Helix-turn-helix transcriptional regulator n=1 Tax=Paenibacillus sabuli TaxID=2772509 RepID=A0A927GQC3_9BACL|nr:AraC family transcriptional regulator [Paenibacillus sabuli]MBD2844126.1 helix-turn-helix transcriptional regulator [Paenibacillus sabuli]